VFACQALAPSRPVRLGFAVFDMGSFPRRTTKFYFRTLA
jgi:hypothetical protein